MPEDYYNRHRLESVQLHGQTGAVDLEAAREATEERQDAMKEYDLSDDIFNVDETGIFYWGIPNRSYVPNGAQLTARGFLRHEIQGASDVCSLQERYGGAQGIPGDDQKGQAAALLSGVRQRGAHALL